MTASARGALLSVAANVETDCGETRRSVPPVTSHRHAPGTQQYAPQGESHKVVEVGGWWCRLSEKNIFRSSIHAG